MSVTTIVASTVPMGVLCVGNPPAEGVEPYRVTLAGTNSPDAVSHTGITYNVDATAFDEWLAANPVFVPHIRTITEAEIDELADQQDEYGFQLGLQDDSEPLPEMADLDGAGQRLRRAETAFRQAVRDQNLAEARAEASKAERDVAAEAQRRIVEAMPAPHAPEQPAERRPQ